jgi:hypothetical protein
MKKYVTFNEKAKHRLERVIPANMPTDNWCNLKMRDRYEVLSETNLTYYVLNDHGRRQGVCKSYVDQVVEGPRIKRNLPEWW